MANLEDEMSKLTLEQLYERLHATRMSRRGAKRVRVDEEGRPKPAKQTRPQAEKATPSTVFSSLSPEEAKKLALKVLGVTES